MVTQRPELHCVPVKSPWFHIAIDFIGPINPVSAAGNCYILTVSDYFTKFTEAVRHYLIKVHLALQNLSSR